MGRQESPVDPGAGPVQRFAFELGKLRPEAGGRGGGGARRFSAVCGPSGSGKSSLLRAGLIPALQSEPSARLRPAAIRILSPGPHPARTHTALFTPKDGPGDTVVVIDQFE